MAEPLRRASLTWLVLAGFVGAQDPSDPSRACTLGEAWQLGRQRMAAQRVPGLVIVLPPENAPAPPELVAAVKGWPAMRVPPRLPPVRTARDGLLRLLQIWRWPQPQIPVTQPQATSPVDLSVLFGLAVVMVLDADTCGARPGETLLLLTPDGKVGGRFSFPLTDETALRLALAPLLEEKAIAARLAAIPKDLAADVQLAQSPAADPTTWEALMQRRRAEDRLARNLHRVAPALVEFQDVPDADDKDGKRKVRILQGSRLLRELGAREHLLGTESGEPARDPCPTCGMGSVLPSSQMLLKLLPK